MTRFFSAILALPVLAGACAAAAATPTLREGETFYFQSQIPEARQAFSALAADPGASVQDRDAALRDLARIQWLIDVDAKAALASLDQALTLSTDHCRTLLMSVRVLDESGDMRAAAARAHERHGDCPGQAQGDDLTGAEMKALLDDAAAAGTSDAMRRQDLQEAGAAMARLSADTDASPKAQALRLRYALEIGDAPHALQAWKGFLWLTDRNAPAPFGISDAEVERRFRSGLAPDAAASNQVALLSLLVRGGFYREAERFDAAHGVAARAGADPAYARVKLYFDMRRDIDSAILDFNRATARGKRDDSAFVNVLEAKLQARAAKVEPGSKRTPLEVLHDAYGLYGTDGTTGGYASLHAGHVVQDERMAIEQFGRKGEVRFLVIENPVSNGYQSWLWDGGAQAGGWSEQDGTIVQVRPAYTGGSLQALASFQPEIAKRLADRQPALERSDLEALAKAPVAYLPGLQARLQKQADEQVAARARAEADRTGQPYARVFARLYWDLQVGHSIRIHEGRHSLDHLQFTGAAALTGPELEYRAKLSELELAELPRMALYNILSSEIGSQSPHGIANTRILEGYSRWVDAHRGEVKGFDPAVPTPVQLDKLSDEQIHAIAHSLDPQFGAQGNPQSNPK
ncbi:MAG: hypothetical protein JSR45_07435 [Proteobacteria bacterium]|nr:hypothetical protein [Pseudomonadota bacterium]